MQREVLISLWCPETGHEEMEQSCVQGSSDGTPAEGSSGTGQVPQGNGQDINSVSVKGASG